ncbi:hypothetical protein D3C84_1023860 [compost metagenome]
MLSAQGAGSIGFRPSLNSTTLNSEKITSRTTSFQWLPLALSNRHRPRSIRIRTRAQSKG